MRQRPTFTQETGNSISLTHQGKDLGIREAINRYRAGTLLERTGFYYDDQFHFPDEAEPIDLGMLDHVQKLELLAKKTKQLAELKAENPELFAQHIQSKEDLISDIPLTK